MSLSNRTVRGPHCTWNEQRGAARSIIDYCRLELRLPSVRLTQYHKVTSVVIVKSPQTGRIPAHVLDTASLVPWPKIHWRLVLTIRRVSLVREPDAAHWRSLAYTWTCGKQRSDRKFSTKGVGYQVLKWLALVPLELALVPCGILMRARPKWPAPFLPKIEAWWLWPYMCTCTCM